MISINPRSVIGDWEMAEVAGEPDSRLHSLMRRIGGNLMDQEPLRRESAENLAEEALDHLMRNHQKGDTISNELRAQGRVLAAPIVRRLRRCIHARLSERICLEELAVEAGVSTHQLLIGFRQAFGTTPAQYIIAQRIRAARRLLATTGHDLTSIALDVGFSSHSHLTRAFRQHTGDTPSRVRENRELRETG